MNDQQKQKLLIEYLVSSPDTYAKCSGILKPEYFAPELKQSIVFINQYYQDYHTTPSPEQIEAETDNAFNVTQITKDQIQYCANEIEKFCQRKALERAILASPELIEKGDYGRVEQLIKDALSVSLETDLGISYFEDPQTRLEQLIKEPLRIPTGMDQVDNLMGGGIAKGEILLVCANSGGGKSITLANLAHNWVRNGFNVLYLTLELSERLVAQRFDIMMSGIGSPLHQQKYKEIINSINKISQTESVGSLIVKRMNSGTTSNQIRGYLKEYELKNNFTPDMIIVDYLDLMNPNEKIPPHEIWTKDKYSSEQLKDLAEEYQVPIATASQLNRTAIDADFLHQGHTAGGISKVNTIDWQLAIIQSETQKSQGEIMFQFLKARSSDAKDKVATQAWDGTRLLIKNQKKKDDIKDFISKKAGIGLPEKSKSKLSDLFNE